jgi:hypothetical protein
MKQQQLSKLVACFFFYWFHLTARRKPNFCFSIFLKQKQQNSFQFNSTQISFKLKYRSCKIIKKNKKV